MSDVALIAIATATIVVAAAIVFSKARALRFGVYIERERFEEIDDDEQLDDDDDQPTQEFERRWPSE